MLKRAFDVTCALAGLIAFSPALAVIAALVKIGDPGPALYRAERIGLDGTPFKMLKFRTMRLRPTEGAAITMRDDPRVTPVGRALRKLKLDEAPQLVNVLRGDMSLVGPRPEAPVYVALYTPEQRRALSVRPGVTGLAQIIYRDESDLLAGPDPETLYRTVAMPAKLRIDLLYIANQSFWLDLRIIALTFAVIISPRAAAFARGLVPSYAQGAESVMGNALTPAFEELPGAGRKERYG